MQIEFIVSEKVTIDETFVKDFDLDLLFHEVYFCNVLRLEKEMLIELYDRILINMVLGFGVSLRSENFSRNKGVHCLAFVALNILGPLNEHMYHIVTRYHLE
jgi:hypothetical protein